MHPSSIWSREGLVPLPSVQDPAWSAQGIESTDTGQAVCCLADCGRSDGWARLPAGGLDCTRLSLPGAGTGLVFRDQSFLLVHGNGRVFPAPFKWSKPGPVRATTLANRLNALGDWPPEWYAGPKHGRLAPAFLPRAPILGTDEENWLIKLGKSLLAALGAMRCVLTWMSQPVTREGNLWTPQVIIQGQQGFHHQERAMRALERLWVSGYPIPALPGQSLRDGAVVPTALDLLIAAPPMKSAHERIQLAADAQVREISAIVDAFQPTSPDAQ